MSDHVATTHWERETPDFKYDSYGRDHTLTLGPAETALRASSAPAYLGNPSLPNPEDLLVAAISSCHMLTFLAVAARKGYVVDSYDDQAIGTMEKDARGSVRITRAVLRPRVMFGGDKQPDAPALAALHDAAHRGCFIANSVSTEIRVEPTAG